MCRPLPIGWLQPAARRRRVSLALGAGSALDFLRNFVACRQSNQARRRAALVDVYVDLRATSVWQTNERIRSGLALLGRMRQP